jgi:hypothetical protein
VRAFLHGVPVALGLTTVLALTARCGGSPSSPAPPAADAEACIPSTYIRCASPAGCAGFQVCNAQGSGYAACECDGTGGGLDAGADASGADSIAADADEGGDAAGTAIGAGVPISSSSQDVFESEDQLAVAPDGTIAIAWIAIVRGAPGSWIAYRFSKDGGATFSSIGRLSLPTGLAGSDPAVAVDAAGNFYLAALGVHFTGTGQAADYTRVFVAKAASGGTAFGAPVEVSNPSPTFLYDHPKILVTASGTIVVSFAQFTSMMATTNGGLAATSRDGQTWRIGTIVDAASVQMANLFWLCEGAGILYAAYLEATPTDAHIALRSSTDQGVTWSPASGIVSLASEIPAGLDPTCVASGNDVWVAYATNTSPATDPTTLLDSAQTIRVAHSADRGSTVGATRMDALDTAAGMLGLLPVLVREPGGALDVAYLGGNSEGDATGSMRYARTAGARFGASVGVDRPLFFTMKRNTVTWLGDYLGAVVSGGKLLLAYPMNAGGATHIYFRSMPLP